VTQEVRSRARQRPKLLTSEHPEPSFCAMGRRRAESIALPEHVHRVKAGGRVYFYYQEGRGKRNPAERGPRLKIAGNPLTPAGSLENARFWAELNRIVATSIVYPAKSLGVLVDRYRDDDAFKRLEAATRASYDVHFTRFQKPDAWGLLDVDSLTPFAVKTGRDALASTPVMANQMLSVGRTLYDWGVVLGLAKQNPFEKVPPLDVPDRGHVPWPGWAVDYVRKHAPPDIVRLVRLGIATCQRESDLVAWARSTARLSGAGVACGAVQKRRAGAGAACSFRLP